MLAEAECAPTHTYTTEQICDAINSTGNVSTVFIEGNPIYLNPIVGSTEEWGHPALLQGYRLANDIYLELRGRGLNAAPTYLVDDYNHMQHVPDLSAREAEFLSELAQLQIMQVDTAGLYALETHFVDHSLSAEDKRNQCSHLDAQFQATKLLSYLTSNNGQSIDKARTVLVHPESFQAQQSAMLERLASLIWKDPRYAELRPESKVQVRSMLCDFFRHIWIGESGEVHSITKPVFDAEQGKYVHQKIL